MMVAVKQPPLLVRWTVFRVVDGVEQYSAVLESKLFNELDAVQLLYYGAIVVTQQKDDLAVEFVEPVEESRS